MATQTFGETIVHYREGSIDEEILSGSFHRDIFFIPEYFLKKDDVVFDIGSHIGTFSLHVASKATEGRVYAFEACKETYDLFKKSVEANNYTNIHHHHMAIAAEDGEVQLFHDLEEGSWGNTISKAVSDTSETVQAKSLKNFITENSVDHIDYMRFNCEGAEFEILKNCPADILSKINLILVLYHEDLAEGHRKEELVQYLQAAGFDVSLRDQTKTRGWLIARNKKHTLTFGQNIVMAVKLLFVHAKIFARNLVKK